ncbi:hypothetical protein QQ045_010322 [Rhodiola kirilowii]
MGVMDLPLVGRKFTWGNRNGASRLDMFLISPGLLSLWPNMEQRGLDKGPSDHAAVALLEENKFWGRRPFRLLDVWLEDPRIKELICEAWKSMEDSGWKGFTIQRKLARVRSVIAQWKRNSSGDVKSNLTKARVEWERLSLLQDSRGLSEEDFLKKAALQKRIWQLETKDERIWRQKSRISWLKEGDQNSKFFHRFAELLESKLSEDEIRWALNECDGSKAPGSDGFNVNFYKKYWCYVKEEVVGFIEEFCENGRLAKGINKTFLALIPKVESPQSFRDFRPISLVNSMYKILSKCLAKRLSSILPSLISPNQSAFLANRSILDGIMVINELIHAMKREKRTALIIKLDFRKAYDSVSWEYLETVQSCMGFGSKWIDLMKECYSCVRMAVLVNGAPSKEFPMEKGLRQGDPLSPFLFLLAAEGLSRIINKAVEDGYLSGVE